MKHDVTVILHTEAVMPAEEVDEYLGALLRAGWPKRALEDFMETGKGVWVSKDGEGRSKITTVSQRPTHSTKGAARRN